jgi:hypothetical protein
MSSPSPPPSSKGGKSLSRTGRVISATARKLTAPASTFIKTVRLKKSKKLTVPSASVTGDKRQPLGSSSQQGSTSKRRRVVLSDDDEEEEDGSLNGDVLNKDSDVLMEAPAPASEPGSERDSAIDVDGVGSDFEEPEVDAEAELGEFYFSKKMFKTYAITEHLQKDWTAPIYAFFNPKPIIEYVDNRWCHTFVCAANPCRHGKRHVR